jgi:hypothetical protein
MTVQGKRTAMRDAEHQLQYAQVGSLHSDWQETPKTEIGLVETCKIQLHE